MYNKYIYLLFIIENDVRVIMYILLNMYNIYLSVLKMMIKYLFYIIT